LIRFEKNDWKTVFEDDLPQESFGMNSKQVCGRFFSRNKDEILSVYLKNYVMNYSVFRIENNKLEKINLSNNIFSENIFSKEDTLMCLHDNKNNKDEILAFNNKWRFNLRFISPEESSLYTSSVPEFLGFPAGQNPKFYEYPKFISGNFTGNGMDLICILYNCKDPKFDGHNCHEVENVDDLPNRIQLYSIGK